ncbi:hypothetical protein [Alteromonas antoniana]|uniref:hypothetical protein n=1 Tax=Alteromonas antoniana TaxID=2803813 RepID=UPI001C471404|nr:hypothetical protein [Alteromonas antoniana]
MKNPFLEKEKQTVSLARKQYHVAQRRTEYATERAKTNARLLVAKPSSLLTFFGFGAYKGATSDNPPSRRRQALVTFARTLAFNVLG